MSSYATSASTAEEANAPLLRSRDSTPSPTSSSSSSSSSSSPARTATLALLLGRATGRGRGPSMLVRETAARELEERRADWGYSKPVVALDMLWNTAFVVVSIVMLIVTLDEKPDTPIRLWICGYALQCLVHVVLVWLEYRRRNASRTAREDDRSGGDVAAPAHHNNDTEEEEDEDAAAEVQASNRYSSNLTKRCESINTMASFLWWIVGFYWVVSGGDMLLHRAPRLYWYTP